MATFEDIMASDPAAAPEGTVPPRSRRPGRPAAAGRLRREGAAGRTGP